MSIVAALLLLTLFHPPEKAEVKVEGTPAPAY